MTRNDRSRTLTRRQRRFALALATNKSVKAAAHAIGIAEVTGFRWLRLPQVRAAANTALDGVLAGAAHEAAAQMTQAVRALAEIMEDQAASASARVAAARCILEVSLRYHETLSLVERVAALEEELEA